MIVITEFDCSWVTTSTLKVAFNPKILLNYFNISNHTDDSRIGLGVRKKAVSLIICMTIGQYNHSGISNNIEGQVQSVSLYFSFKCMTIFILCLIQISFNNQIPRKSVSFAVFSLHTFTALPIKLSRLSINYSYCLPEKCFPVQKWFTWSRDAILKKIFELTKRLNKSFWGVAINYRVIFYKCHAWNYKYLQAYLTKLSEFLTHNVIGLAWICIKILLKMV